MKSAKKVLYLMEYPIDLPGGAQLSTISICRAINDHYKGRQAGSVLEPVVCCPDLLQPDKNAFDFRIRTYPMGERRLINFIIRLFYFIRIIRSEKPDIIHIQMSESLITYGFIAWLFPNIPYIYTDRGMYFGYRRRSMFFIKRALKKCSLLITTTRSNRALWERGSSVRPIAVIPNTISEVFSSYDETKKKRGGKFTIGLAGRICEEKD